MLKIYIYIFFYFIVTAVDQLKIMAHMKQYKETSQLLQVGHAILNLFF
jgi:hypothetical protein